MAKVLVVEDNEMNRDMLARRLQRKGYTVVTATDGQQAVTLAGTEKPDLILMDISLPVLDGWEATRQIKNSRQLGAVPIVALTAHAMAGDKEKCLEAGCNDYESKPLDFSRLLGKIEKLLGSQRREG